jgi:DNA replication and repair protein RecF
VGKNGIGKTNVLMLFIIYPTVKVISTHLQYNIKHGEEFFVIDAAFIKNERTEQVVCSLKKAKKKY